MINYKLIVAYLPSKIDIAPEKNVFLNTKKGGQ